MVIHMWENKMDIKKINRKWTSSKSAILYTTLYERKASNMCETVNNKRKLLIWLIRTTTFSRRGRAVYTQFLPNYYVCRRGASIVSKVCAGVLISRYYPILPRAFPAE